MKKLSNTRTNIRTNIRTYQSGFTLIEIMVVVIIIGLLATLIVPNIIGQQEKALEIKAKADVRAISTQLSMYKLDNFSYPSTSQGLGALVTNPGKSTWRQYLNKMPKDPWQNPYQYAYPGSKNPTLMIFGVMEATAHLAAKVMRPISVIGIRSNKVIAELCSS